MRLKITQQIRVSTLTTVAMTAQRLMKSSHCSEHKNMEKLPKSIVLKRISDDTVPLSVSCWCIMSTTPNGLSEKQQNVMGANKKAKAKGLIWPKKNKHMPAQATIIVNTSINLKGGKSRKTRIYSNGASMHMKALNTKK